MRANHELGGVDLDNLLFHGTSVYCLANIIDQDRLDESAHWGKRGEPHGPRLSRSPRVAAGFVRYNIHWGEGGMLVLNRKLLEADFEVVRYVDRSYEGDLWPEDEEEEVPLTPSIANLSRYLVSIVCDPMVIELAQAVQNLEYSRAECGWGFEHTDNELAIASLRRLAASPLLNRWVPPIGVPRIGNWLSASGAVLENSSPAKLATHHEVLCC